MALNKTDKSFKILINKEFTTDPDTGGRSYYQEYGSDTLNLHQRELWMAVLPADSASAVSESNAEYYNEFILTPDLVFPTNTFYFMSGSGFTPGVSSYDRDKLVGGFISDKYGADYEVKLYDNSSNQIFKTDPINWIYDYVTGILHIAEPGSGSYSTPYKLDVFRYTGKVLQDSGSILASQVEGGTFSRWTGSFTSSDASIHHVGDVKVTGSFDVTKNITVDGLHVWNNISASNLYWKSGSDLTSFSASIASQIEELTAGSGSQWTGSADGSISRASDVTVTGSFIASGSFITLGDSTLTGDVIINGGLNIDQTQYQNAIVIDTDRYINFSGQTFSILQGWLLGQVSSPADTIFFEFNKTGNNVGYFVFSRGAGDKTNVIIFSGSLVVNKDVTDYNPSSAFEVYGSSYMGGNIAVPALATVDGVDISEFSSSVANEINNLATGSSKWTLLGDNSIERQSDIRVTGSIFGLDTATNTLRVGNATRYLNFHNTTGDLEFGLSPVLSIHDSANYLKLTTGTLSWVYSTTPLKIASSQSIEFEPDIIGGGTGSVNIIGDFYVENDVQVTGSIKVLASASFRDFVEVDGFMHVDGGTY